MGPSHPFAEASTKSVRRRAQTRRQPTTSGRAHELIADPDVRLDGHPRRGQARSAIAIPLAGEAPTARSGTVP